MRTRVLVAAVTFVVTGAIAGCDRTTPGTVAMTTEPGGATHTSTSSRPTTSSDAPPPGDALDVTCKEYVGLDEASRTALIAEILNGETSVLGPGDAEIAKSLADAVCTFLPTSKVSDILLGETPP